MSRSEFKSRIERMGVRAEFIVDGNKIAFVRFLSDLVSGTIIGMIESLKEVLPTWKHIEIIVDRRMGIEKDDMYHLPLRTEIRIDGQSISVGGYVNDWFGRIVTTMCEPALIKDIDPNWKFVRAHVERKYF